MKKLDKEKCEDVLEYRYGLEDDSSLECPYCRVPLVRGLTVCPKCKYDTATQDGGPEHQNWLVTHEREAEPETPKEPEMPKIAPETVELTTLQTLEGYTILENAGPVFGEVFATPEEMQEMSLPHIDLTNMPPEENSEDAELSTAEIAARKYAYLRAMVMRKLQERAAGIGANAVIDVVYKSSIEEGILHMVVYGTALYVERKKEEKPKNKLGQLVQAASKMIIMPKSGGRGGKSGTGPMPF